MKTLSLLFCTIVLFGFSSAAFAESSPERQTDETHEAVVEMDLSYFLELARENSPMLSAAEFAIDKAKARQGEADWAWLPKIEADFIFVPSPTLGPEDDTYDVFNNLDSWGISTKSSIRFVLPVYTFSKLSTYQELAEVGVDVEVLRREQELLKVTYDVARAYYGFQLTKALSVVLDDGGSKLDQASKLLDDLLDKGSEGADKSDRYQLDIVRGGFERRVLQAKQAQRLATDALRIHTEVTGQLRLPKMNFQPDRVTLQGLEKVLEIAGKHRIDLRLLNEAVEAQGLKLKIERLGWTPDFYIAGSFSHAFSNAVPDFPNDPPVPPTYLYNPYNAIGPAVLFGLRWRVDPSQRIFRTEQEEHGLSRLEAQRTIARRGAMLGVEKAYFKVIDAQVGVRLLRKSRRAAKRRMTQLYADYEIGGGNIDVLSRAVSTYFEQRAEYLQSLHDFRVSVVHLQLVTGAPSIGDLIKEGKIDGISLPQSNTP